MEHTQEVQIHCLPQGKKGWKKGELLACTIICAGYKVGDLRIAQTTATLPPLNTCWQAQHLYLTSDEKPKAGQWGYDHKVGGIMLRVKDVDGNLNTAISIVACNQPDMNECGVPRIPQSLLQAYANSNGAMKSCRIVMDEVYDDGGDDGIETWDDIPKLINNEVVIVEEKERGITIVGGESKSAPPPVILTAEDWFISIYPNQSPADFAIFSTMDEYADYILKQSKMK